jgi:hypothetical protein
VVLGVGLPLGHWLGDRHWLLARDQHLAWRQLREWV